ncbi:MAG: ATP-binding protein [Oscillospiraceae bacterium]|nr:ATP-binding protein [Oscillospiraceae bacterium]
MSELNNVENADVTPEVSIGSLQAELKRLKKENKSLERKLADVERIKTDIENHYEFERNLNDILTAQKEQQDLYLKLMFQYTPDIIFIIDTDYKLVTYTRATMMRYGVSFDDSPSNSVFELFGRFVPPEKLERSMYNIKNVMNGGPPKRDNDFVIYGSSRTYNFETSTVPLKNADDVIMGVMVNMNDVTQLHEALRAANHANEAKSNFLAKTSHEIRTPMNAVMGLSEMVLREELSKVVRGHVCGIKEACDHLMSIINDILDFSKIESGMMEIVPYDYSLVSLITNAIGLTRSKVVDLPILFVADVAANVPNRLFGDEIRIKQMMLNLLSNATKYNNQGFIKLSVRHEDHAEDKNTILLYLSVADSGHGIREEDIDKLFGEFMQLGGVESREITGTGLGLPITQKLAHMMGGEITVESEHGVGSVFTIVIPQKRSDITPEDNEENQSNVFAQLHESAKNTAVLVYETRDVFAESLAFSLDNLGVNHTIVSDHAEFAAQTEQNGKAYDFVFVSSFSHESVQQFIQEYMNPETIVVLITEYGELAVENETTRTLFMPAHTADIAHLLSNANTYTTRDKKHKGANFVAPTARVLIVDDINTNLIVAQGLLSSYQMEVDSCKSGQAAIDAVASTEFDVIFMDHMMPGMDGIEATAVIRAMTGSEHQRYYYKNVPIIALTANAVSGMKEMFLQNGFNDFLAKPIDVTLLDSILRKWLPSDKLEERVETDENTAGSGLALKSLQVKGIDVEAGIYMTGGNADSYLKTLTVFRDDGLEKVTHLRDSVRNEDWKLYGIHIHALKSASASIGAAKVSTLARNLEAAAKNDNGDFIVENSEKFLEELSMLIESITAAITTVRSARKQTDSAAVKIDASLFRERAAALKIALETFDMEEVDALLAKLKENVPPDSEPESVLEEISNNVLICEYEHADELVDRLVALIAG